MIRDYRVTSEFWVSAYKRVLDSRAVPIFVVRKGDPKAGAILVRISDLQGLSKVFIQSYDILGDRKWLELANGNDSAMEDIILRQKELDPDLWVLEVETRHGHHYLDSV